MDKIILAVGDLHLPFHSRETVEKIYTLAEAIQPDYIIQMGDLFDLFSHSKFPKSVKDPSQEVDSAREEADIFWSTMHLVSPNSEKYQIRGNHDVRPMKRLMEKCPEVEMFYDDKWLWQFDGVNTIYNSKEILTIEDIIFNHGWLGRSGAHARYFMQQCVTGHTHRGGVVSFNDIRRNGEPIWEANAGYAGDPLSVPFSYPAVKFTHWTHGAVVIDKYGPRFIHL